MAAFSAGDDVDSLSQIGTITDRQCWQFVVKTENEKAETNNKNLTILMVSATIHLLLKIGIAY